MQKQKKERQFAAAEVVWVKLRGFPWWPAQIKELMPMKTNGEWKYFVDFYAENTSSFVIQSKLHRYQDKRQEFSLPKQKLLQEAIKLADLAVQNSNKEEVMPVPEEKVRKASQKLPVKKRYFEEEKTAPVKTDD